MYAAVCPKCGGFKASADGLPDFGISGDIAKLIKVFYKGYKPGKIAVNLASKVAATISEAVAQGYAQKFYQVAWNSPDWDMIQNLQRNVYQFSFAKTHEQLKAMTAALYDKDGNIVSENEHKEVCNRINNEYTGRYLPVERNTAIGSGQMASRWVQFQKEKDIFPNLTYRTVGDANVRPSHQLLDGVTRPIGDGFWKTHYTPNGWGCRCDVEQSTGSWVTDMSKVVLPTDIPKMFRTNLAEHGLVFPKDHPYYDHVPDDVLKAADNNNPFLYEKIHTGKDGGYVYNNPMHSKLSDWDNELHTVKILANSGEKVIMLPEIDPSNKVQTALRKMVLPKQLHTTRKSPDCKIGDDLVELKTCMANTANSIDALIRAGKKQADIVCIRLTDKMKPAALKKAIKGRVARAENVKGIWIIQRGSEKLVKYSRAEIEKF
jgi:hypothetical protein